jgi:hypothetical protein
MATLNFTYFTNYIKASIGTTAHLVPEPTGILQLVAGQGMLTALYRRRAR